MVGTRRHRSLPDEGPPLIGEPQSWWPNNVPYQRSRQPLLDAEPDVAALAVRPPPSRQDRLTDELTSNRRRCTVHRASVPRVRKSSRNCWPFACPHRDALRSSTGVAPPLEVLEPSQLRPKATRDRYRGGGGSSCPHSGDGRERQDAGVFSPTANNVRQRLATPA
jgi:hypothetical protein